MSSQYTLRTPFFTPVSVQTHACHSSKKTPVVPVVTQYPSFHPSIVPLLANTNQSPFTIIVAITS